jgi:hypothetical protein
MDALPLFGLPQVYRGAGTRERDLQMPCEWLKDKDGNVIHLNYGRSGGKKKLCPFCKKGRVSKLCDFPLTDSLVPGEEPKTCDAEMCDGCARTLGRGQVQIAPGLYRMNDSIDVCPTHRGSAVVVEGKITAHDF